MQKTVLIYNEDAEWMCGRLAALCPDYRFRAADTLDGALALAPDAQILMGLAPYIPQELVKAMPGLEWIHALTTGYDNLLTMPGLGRHVAISNSKGFHGPQMAELAILSMMALARDYRAFLANQQKRIWERRAQPLLSGKTVCIVGLGSIGEALAQRCLSFGMRMTGVSDGRAQLDGFERIYPRADIETAVSDADFVVVIVPYGPQTHHIVGDAVFAAMKPSAYLVNIARGGCVDEDALLKHLDSGSIAGAALDVFATEPLPPESRFWSHPKVIVTPHIGGMADVYHEQVLPLVAEHLNVYAAKGASKLPNLVRPVTSEVA